MEVAFHGKRDGGRVSWKTEGTGVVNRQTHVPCIPQPYKLYSRHGSHSPPPRAGRADRCLATAHELVHLLSVVQAVQGCRVAEKMSAKRRLRSFFLQPPPLFNCINLLLRIVAQRLRNGCDIICRNQIKRCEGLG